MKKSILISSLVVAIILLAEAYRENLKMDWQHYQRLYRRQLIQLARTPKEKELARDYGITMNQIVLPDLNRVDRCIICHVGIEDPRMADAPQPLRSHPGDILEVHPPDETGCTVCHDGQGRAVTKKEAHAVTLPYWEKPLLGKPFLQSNCTRCHNAEFLPELEVVNQGRKLFFSKGCLGCHQLNAEGGNLAPDLNNIADANVHLKHPLDKKLIEKFDHNVNIAYIYESIRQPKVQPEISAMPEFDFDEKEALALTVFLKGFSQKAVPAFYNMAKNRQRREPEPLTGEDLFCKYCVACHGQGAKGGVENINYIKTTVPALNTLAERMFLDGPEDAGRVAGLLENGVDIVNMSPELDVSGSGRVLAQYQAITKVIKNGSIAGKADPTGPEPLLHMPSWSKGLTDEDINKIIAYLLTLQHWDPEIVP